MNKKVIIPLLLSSIIAGCNSGSDDITAKPENGQPGVPGNPGTSPGAPGIPGVGVIPFDVSPYVQRPKTDSMTVRFEIKSDVRNVYYRQKVEENSDANEWVKHEATPVPIIHNAYHLENLVEAELNELDSHTIYEYFVETDFGQTPVYQFKTWPKKTDVEDGHVYKFAHYADTHANNYISKLVEGLIQGECDSLPENCVDELASIYIAGDIAGYLGHDHIATRKTLNLFSAIAPYVPVSISFGNHDKDKFWETPKMYFKLPEISDSDSVDKDVHWWEDRYLDTWLVGHNSEIERTDPQDIERQANHWETRIRAHSNDYHAEEHSGVAYDLINYSVMMTHFSCESETWQDKKQTICDWIDLNDLHSAGDTIHGGGERNRWLGLHIYGHNHGGFNIGQSQGAPTIWAGLPSATRACRNCYGHVEFDRYESRWAGRGVMISEMTYVDFKHEDGRDRRNMTVRILDATGGYDTTNEIKTVKNTVKPQKPVLGDVADSINMLNPPQQLVVSTSDFVDSEDYAHHETWWQLEYVGASGKKEFEHIWGKKTRARYWMYDEDRNEGNNITEHDIINSLSDIYQKVNDGVGDAQDVTVTLKAKHRNEFFVWSNWSEGKNIVLTSGMPDISVPMLGMNTLGGETFSLDDRIELEWFGGLGHSSQWVGVYAPEASSYMTWLYTQADTTTGDPDDWRKGHAPNPESGTMVMPSLREILTHYGPEPAAGKYRITMHQGGSNQLFGEVFINITE
ncbi:metallophosphoesterase [Photobacterium minamisatsumaniensis]|uniref:metallophosphoesterase n=1 Tax=Photobacterium minamisatsumaniensis TaxID=2910233 RepID=UPI003D0C431D